MDSKKPLYKFKTLWVLTLFLLYSALGFFAVPYFVKKQLYAIAINDLNSQLSIDAIQFNPFTISIDILDIKMTDADKTVWFSAKSVHANVDLWDTLMNHLSLDEIQVNHPYYLLNTEDNNTDSPIKYPKISQSNQTIEQEVEFLIAVENIDIKNGSLEFSNSSGLKNIHLNIKEIIFHHDAFTTLDADSQFSLSFITDKNDKATLSGLFNFVQSRFELSWSLENWSTETLFHLIGDPNNQMLGLVNKTGSIDANGTLSSASDSDLMPSLLIKSLALTDFKNVAESAKELQISIPQLLINNTDINLNTQSIALDSVTLDALDLSLSIDKNNTPLLGEILSAQNTPTHPDTNEADWNYTINTIQLNQSKIHLNKLNGDESSTNNLHFESMQFKNINSLPEQITDMQFVFNINNEGKIEVQSQLTSQPFSVTNTIKMEDINLNHFQAWIPDDIQLEISEGLLSLEQKLIINDTKFVSSGWVKLNNLTLLDNNKQTFFSINQLDLQQINIDSSTHKVTLNNAVLDQAEGTLIISEQQQLNLNTIVPETTHSNSDDSDNQNSENQDSENESWIIEIQDIEFINGKTSFTDQSIKPIYHTELSKLNGNIKDLNSDNIGKATIKLSGLVDTYSQLSIAGQINPISDSEFSDLSILVKDLSLQNLSSYSGHYLGFPITRGKADFKFNYKLNESLLDGLNDLTFKQLKFGDKSPSEDAIKLPLKLAVGLLTNGKGIMKINLPVSGNIDDPEFSYGGIVFKAFFKLITGIVASPFKLLGKLIPGGADLDLSGIRFQAGTLILLENEEAKLKAMKSILKQRPGIILEISGVVNTLNDSNALQVQQLLKKLKWGAIPEFSSDFPFAVIEDLYVSSFTSEKWQQLKANLTIDGVINLPLLAKNVWEELLTNENIEGKLTVLAKHRVQYIQAQLIEEYQVANDKVFIKPNELSEVLHPQVKFSVGQ